MGKIRFLPVWRLLLFLRVLLYIPGWTWTHYVVVAGFQLLHPPSRLTLLSVGITGVYPCTWHQRSYGLELQGWLSACPENWSSILNIHMGFTCTFNSSTRWSESLFLSPWALYVHGTHIYIHAGRKLTQIKSRKKRLEISFCFLHRKWILHKTSDFSKNHTVCPTIPFCNRNHFIFAKE